MAFSKPVTPCRVNDDTNNIDAVAQRWSPEDLRIARAANKQMKASAKNTETELQGGDYVITRRDGKLQTATLSFCFQIPYSTKRYGLTVGHIAERVGEEIYTFASDLQVLNGKFATMHIGTVVSLSQETDSLIFEIKRKCTVSCLNIVQTQDFTRAIKLPPRNISAMPSVGTKFIVFGAKRRGAIGVVTGTAIEDDRVVLKGDVRIMSVEPGGNQATGRRPLTDPSDCGAVYADEQGTAWCMHHVLGQIQNTTYTSYGVPISTIMDCHPKYFRGSCHPLKAVCRRRLLQAKKVLSRATKLTKKAISRPFKSAVLHQTDSTNTHDSDSEILYVCDDWGVPTGYTAVLVPMAEQVQHYELDTIDIDKCVLVDPETGAKIPFPNV